MSDTNQGDATKRAPIPLKIRLKAWWRGYDLTVKERRPAEEEPVAPVDKSVYQLDPNRPKWETARVHIVQKIWGSGFNTPGHEQHVLDLVKPFGLNEKKSLLHIGCGLGGGSRAISKEFNTWVAALERDPEMATAGQALSEQSGMAKKAQVSRCDLEVIELEKRRYDCVLANEVFFGVEHKERLFKGIGTGLKHDGQFMFTDFVINEDPSLSRDVDTWVHGEKEPVFPWGLQNYENLLQDVGFDIRVMEDITASYLPKVVSGFKNFISNSRECVSNKQLAEILVDEVEMWNRRSIALDKGALKLYRFYVLGRKETKLMSDW